MIFQSILSRLPERGRKKRDDRGEKKCPSILKVVIITNLEQRQKSA